MILLSEVQERQFKTKHNKKGTAAQTGCAFFVVLEQVICLFAHHF